jgi:hypothetical protein
MLNNIQERGEGYLSIFIFTFKFDVVFEFFDPGRPTLFGGIETILE